jgi:serine/threonine-protein phosphatase 2A regulatory subunit B''
VCGGASIDPKAVELLFENHCRLPRCFAPLFLTSEPFTPASLQEFWRTKLLGEDPNARLLRIIAGRDRTAFLPTELAPYVHSLVLTHPSLQFLQQEAEFLGHFVEFVVTRMFLILDPEIRGTANVHQLRNIDLAGILFKASQAKDLNETHSLFNYQGFYVALCRFWDLDVDGDGWLAPVDMLNFNDGSISPLILAHYFKSPYYPRSVSRRPLIDFLSFAYLLINAEDKTTPASVHFWFRLCDLDDDGVLSLKEIAELYDVQYERMSLGGYTTIPFGDIYRLLMDIVCPENVGVVTIQDLLACKQADAFFNALINIQKFLITEYQIPTSRPDIDRLSPWEVFAFIEYARLVAETR